MITYSLRKLKIIKDHLVLPIIYPSCRPHAHAPRASIAYAKVLHIGVFVLIVFVMLLKQFKSCVWANNVLLPSFHCTDTVFDFNTDVRNVGRK